MARRGNTAELMAQFIEGLDTEIRVADSAGAGPIVKRRKLRTVTYECGFKKASPQFL